MMSKYTRETGDGYQGCWQISQGGISISVGMVDCIDIANDLVTAPSDNGIVVGPTDDIDEWVCKATERNSNNNNNLIYVKSVALKLLDVEDGDILRGYEHEDGLELVPKHDDPYVDDDDDGLRADGGALEAYYIFDAERDVVIDGPFRITEAERKAMDHNQDVVSCKRIYILGLEHAGVDVTWKVDDEYDGDGEDLVTDGGGQGDYYLVDGERDAVIDGPFYPDEARREAEDHDADVVASRLSMIQALEQVGIDVTWETDEDRGDGHELRPDGGQTPAVIGEELLEKGDEVERLRCQCGKHPYVVVRETGDAYEQRLELGCTCGAHGRVIREEPMGRETITGPFERIVGSLPDSFEDFVADERGQVQLLTAEEWIAMGIIVGMLLAAGIAFGYLAIYWAADAAPGVPA